MTGFSPQPWPGKPARSLGDRYQPHTYTYIPDIGEGLAVLGEHPDAAGDIWHLPNDPHTRTTQELIDAIYRHAGQPRTRIRTVPPLILHTLALTSPVARELLEMQYQFEEPFIVDSSKITTRLGVTATPLDQAIAETFNSYTTSRPHSERAQP